MQTKAAFSVAFSLFLVVGTSLTSQAQLTQLIWTVGKDDNGWPLTGTGGGPNAVFVQEGGGISPLPGSPNNVPTSPPTPSADNDYYLAGVYTNVIASVTVRPEYGDYTPVGEVLLNEEAAERAFAGSDLDQRYHFNLPSTLKTNDFLTVTFDALNLDDPNNPANTDLRFGVEVYFNGVLVQTQIVIHPVDLDTDYTTPRFSLASVNAQVGPGFDNIVSLRGISYNADGGGNWMGIDYVQLNAITSTNPPPLPLIYPVGKDDNAHPTGTGGGANTSFVQENGSINPLPGSPVSTSVSKGADNDYYFSGVYTNVIASVTARPEYGDYTPVGVVSVNEEAAERAFADADNDLRYHFNLPSSLRPFDVLSVTFDVYDLDDPSVVNTDPRYGVEVYFNGVLVQPQILVRPVDIDTDYTTAQFRLDSVNAQAGPGYDNIVSLRGINYNDAGGGNWMGIDYVQINAGPSSLPPDTNAPTVVSVSRYGDVAKLKVTFSEPVRASTANVVGNYVLSSGATIAKAVLQPDGKTVVLITAPMAIGASDTLTVTGILDIAGNPISSTGNQVNFTSKYQILLVTADPGPLTFAGDQAVLQRLQARGYDVSLSTGTAVPDDGATAIGKDLVIVSSSLASSSVIAAAGGAKFLRSPVPVVLWESALEDDFRFQSAGGNTTNTQTQINIVNANNPLAAGFPAGLLTVTSNAQTFSYGTPVGAHVVATVATDPTLALLYYYEKGEKGLNGFDMPARRVFFFFQDNTASAANAAGNKLFDASVDFAMNVVPIINTNTPTLPLIWTVGLDDNAWPLTGTGGGPNAVFVQETGGISPLPGSPNNAPTDPPSQSADNDYYLAGVYTTVISSVTNFYGDYTPVDVVAADEEAAERAFAGGDLDLRYHFNLPTSLKTTDVLSVTFDANNLHIDAVANPDPRFGVIVYFNGVLVQPEIVIRPGQLDIDYTTPQFSLASVNAQLGPGFDNIVSLRGVSYDADGGGNWMGIDYIQLNAGIPEVGLAFQPAVISNGKVTLNWSGTGTLAWAPTVSGPWTPITPAASGYSENILAGQNRFFRLTNP